MFKPVPAGCREAQLTGLTQSLHLPSSPVQSLGCLFLYSTVFTMLPSGTDTNYPQILGPTSVHKVDIDDELAEAGKLGPFAHMARSQWCCLSHTLRSQVPAHHSSDPYCTMSCYLSCKSVHACSLPGVDPPAKQLPWG